MGEMHWFFGAAALVGGLVYGCIYPTGNVREDIADRAWRRVLTTFLARSPMAVMLVITTTSPRCRWLIVPMFLGVAIGCLVAMIRRERQGPETPRERAINT